MPKAQIEKKQLTCYFLCFSYVMDSCVPNNPSSYFPRFSFRLFYHYTLTLFLRFFSYSRVFYSCVPNRPLVDKIINKIAGWRGRLMSLAARVVLIKSCLSSIHVYLLSFIKFPKWAIKMLNTHMGNFLWDDSENKHRYHLAN